jgi:hypothetical protein
MYCFLWHNQHVSCLFCNHVCYILKWDGTKDWQCWDKKKDVAVVCLWRHHALCEQHWGTEGHVRSLKLNLTPWPLVRKRTIPTERRPLVDEI